MYLLMLPTALVGVAVARAQVASIVAAVAAAALVAGMTIVRETRGQKKRQFCEKKKRKKAEILEITQ